MAKILLCLILTGCAHVTYTGTSPDGSQTQADVWEFFHSESINGFAAKSDKNGREITLDKGNFNPDSQSINAANQALGTIVGTALRAYMGKP